MLRFYCTLFGMVTAFAGIVLVFTQCEGRGTRYATIEALSFSSDDSRIAVTKLTARDALTPMKCYKSNVARTIGWLDSPTGADRGPIHQDFKPGNCGAAFRYWRVGRTSVICNPANDRIVFSALGGGDLTFGGDQPTPRTVSLSHAATNLAVSTSGRFLAASGEYALTIVDTSTQMPVMHSQAGDLPFLHALLMSFSRDESSLVTAGESGVHVWEIASATQMSTLPVDAESWVKAIAVLPDNTVVVCDDSSVKRYSLSGVLLDTCNSKGAHLCCASDSSGQFAAGDYDKITVYDADTNEIKRSIHASGATAIAMSSDGRLLATGDYHGRVSLYETDSGKLKWRANPPGRYRLPWTVPVAFLLIWCWLAYRIVTRDKRGVSQSKSTIQGSS